MRRNAPFYVIKLIHYVPGWAAALIDKKSEPQ
jgi:hypothetical protein